MLFVVRHELPVPHLVGHPMQEEIDLASMSRSSIGLVVGAAACLPSSLKKRPVNLVEVVEIGPREEHRLLLHREMLQFDDLAIDVRAYRKGRAYPPSG